MGLYYDTESAAAFLGLSPKTVRAQAAKGVLRGHKLSPRRMIFAEHALEEYRRVHLGRFGTRSPAHRGPGGRRSPQTRRMRRFHAQIDGFAMEVLELVKWGGTRSALVDACDRLRAALEAEWQGDARMEEYGERSGDPRSERYDAVGNPLNV